jgi:hypothetical protein
LDCQFCDANYKNVPENSNSPNILPFSLTWHARSVCQRGSWLALNIEAREKSVLPPPLSLYWSLLVGPTYHHLLPPLCSSSSSSLRIVHLHDNKDDDVWVCSSHLRIAHYDAKSAAWRRTRTSTCSSSNTTPPRPVQLAAFHDCASSRPEDEHHQSRAPLGRPRVVPEGHRPQHCCTRI